MSIQTHEQIMTEQFHAALADFKLWTELYKKTGKQACLLEAAQKWGMLQGLASAASEFGIGSLQSALDQLGPNVSSAS